MTGIRCGLSASVLGTVTVSTPSARAAVTCSASAWPGSRTRYSNRPERRPRRSARPCVPEAGVPELAAGGQFLAGQFDADIVPGHAGQLDLGDIGLVGLGQVGVRRPGLDRRLPAVERAVQQLAHPLVQVLELGERAVLQERAPTRRRVAT